MTDGDEAVFANGGRRLLGETGCPCAGGWGAAFAHQRAP
jgi:hypothetical protein